IGEIDAHTGVSAAVTVNGGFREKADFFEGTVAFIVIQEFDHGVVGDEEINMAVAIVIRQRDSETFAGFGEANFLRDFGKVAVSVVVVDERRNRMKEVGMTVGAIAFFMFTAVYVIEIPLEIAENNQVQQAVVV